MPYKFFDNLLDSKRERTKRKLTLPVSIGIHVVVLGAVLLVPLLTFSELPDPVMSSAIRAYLVEAAPAPPPPPPPPPPPAASAPKPVTQPKVEQPKPVVEEPKFTAPIETPKELPKPEPATGLDSGPGEPGGEIGGVQGGVKGGTEGGVVGGTIGGVPGGELGGQLGGVPGGIAKEEPPPVPSGPVNTIAAPACDTSSLSSTGSPTTRSWTPSAFVSAIAIEIPVASPDSPSNRNCASERSSSPTTGP